MLVRCKGCGNGFEKMIYGRNCCNECYKKKAKTYSRKQYYNNIEKYRQYARIGSKKRYDKIKSDPILFEEYMKKQRIRTALRKEMRKTIFDKFNNRCVRCGATDELELHHLTYIGGLKEVIVVCKDCHNNYYH